ncbi:opioid growth factor receptor-like isoform X2 [Hyla sarda]|uniref:opioid growth factor receptor-like isoform X2 n=1 Tax=Hyla sarda TaxID=327740 RepID=UPI0024C36817|nr:opioid growth factor receptor-like isoform X2 [Hyla sarda]
MGQTKSKKSVSPGLHVQWESDYDSTWEEEDERPRKKKKNQEVRAKEQSSLVNCFAVDNHEEIHYSIPRHTPNLDFYQNKKPFKPNGVYIEELLSDWKFDYEKLERNHSYIQWLFPLREPGRNSSATPLTMDEIQMMRKDREVVRRFLNAYKLMLGFYGIELQDSDTGKLQKAKNWKERFHNLNNHSHNNLRITRILKCLGEMGYDHFQAPLVRFFLEWTLRDNYLPNVKRSVLDYFMFTVKNKQERRELVQFANENYKSHEPFIWGPEKKLSIYSSEKRTKNEERPTSRKKTDRR